VRKFCIDTSFCLLAVRALYLLPLTWILSAYLAAVIHEAGHLAMLRLLDCGIHRIQIRATGAVIETDSMLWWQEFACALAGPLCSLLLIVFLRVWPEIALCGIAQGAYNLIPVYPLDGGRCVKVLLEHFMANHSKGLQWFVETICWVALIGSQTYMGVLVAVAVFFRKISCKEGKQAVQ